MCGRIIQSSVPADLAIVSGLSASDQHNNHPPRWNGAPSQTILVIREDRKTNERTLEPLKWGLVPVWEKDIKKARKPINAKAETVASLPSFRSAYKSRRCIVPVNGYYEWYANDDGPKQPYAMAMADNSVFGMAGIWEGWKAPDGEWLKTFAIVTVPANTLAAKIHDRMPAILRPDHYERWLGAEDSAAELMGSYPPEHMQIWPVSTRVNSPRNEGKELLDEVPLS